MVHCIETLTRLNNEASQVVEAAPLSAEQLASLSDAAFYCECNKALQRMLKNVSDIGNQTAQLLSPREGLPELDAIPHLRFSMRYMLNGIGDILNNMDACEPEDMDLTDGIFSELRRRLGHDEEHSDPTGYWSFQD